MSALQHSIEWPTVRVNRYGLLNRERERTLSMLINLVRYSLHPSWCSFFCVNSAFLPTDPMSRHSFLDFILALTTDI